MISSNSIVRCDGGVPKPDVGGIGEPDAVTPNATDLLEVECCIDVDDHDIGVIDPTADEVDVL